MKQIYFVITHTGTILSKIIKWYTKEKFTHVSIALDFQLTRMYSFGRLNPYNPFGEVLCMSKSKVVHSNVLKTQKQLFIP